MNEIDLAALGEPSTKKLIKSLYKALDGHSTTAAISAYFEKNGQSPSHSYCKAINVELKKIRKAALINLINELRLILPVNPEKKLISSKAKELGVTLLRQELDNLYSKLKDFPELWEKGGYENLRIAFPASDLSILKMFMKISGEPKNSILKLALRTLLIASGRRQIDMMEAFKSAKELSEREKNQYIQLLSVFNLRKIDSQPALKDKEKK